MHNKGKLYYDKTIFAMIIDVNVIFIDHLFLMSTIFDFHFALIFLVFFWKISIFPKLLQSLEFTPYTIQLHYMTTETPKIDIRVI